MTRDSLCLGIAGLLLLLGGPLVAEETRSLQANATAETVAFRGDRAELTVEMVIMFRQGTKYYTLKPAGYSILTEDPVIDGPKDLNTEIVSADVREVPVSFTELFDQYTARGYAITLKVRFRPGPAAATGTQKVTVRLPGVTRVAKSLDEENHFPPVDSSEPNADFTVKVYESKQAYEAEQQALRDAERKQRETEEANRQTALATERREREQRETERAARQAALLAAGRAAYWWKMGPVGLVFVLDLVLILVLLQRYNRLTRDTRSVALAAEDRLPDVCMCCGQPATARVSQTFSNAEAVGVPPVAVPWLWLQGRLARSTGARVLGVPLCARHRGHFSRRWLAALLLLGLGAAGLAVLYLGLQAGWNEFAVALCAEGLFLGICAFRFFGKSTIHTQRIDGGRVTLAPVANPFIEACAAAQG
jgi:hypothetical protein